jgi:hypothetical protein
VCGHCLLELRLEQCVCVCVGGWREGGGGQTRAHQLPAASPCGVLQGQCRGIREPQRGTHGSVHSGPAPAARADVLQLRRLGLQHVWGRHPAVRDVGDSFASASVRHCDCQRGTTTLPTQRTSQPLLCAPATGRCWPLSPVAARVSPVAARVTLLFSRSRRQSATARAVPWPTRAFGMRQGRHVQLAAIRPVALDQIRLTPVGWSGVNVWWCCEGRGAVFSLLPRSHCTNLPPRMQPSHNWP